MNAAERLGERRCSNPVDLGAETQSCADGVEVGIDQTGDYGTALEIDDARPRAGQLTDRGGIAESQNLPIADGEGFADGILGIHRHNLAVDQDCVGRGQFLRTGGQRGQRDHQ
jgi:hypothetical protein